MKRIVFLVIALVFSACSTTAIVERSDGSSLEAEILGSTPSGLHLKGVAEPVPHDTIVDIDHPGTGSMIGGAGMAGVGVLTTLLGVRVAQTETDQLAGLVVRAGGIGLAASGVVVTVASIFPIVHGYSNWTDSKRKAGEFNRAEKASNKLMVVPMTDGKSAGIVLGTTF